MTRRANKSEILPCAAQGLSFLHRVPLLRSENPDEFNDLLEALKSEISPRGVVEEMYVADIATIIWETLRLRRCKVALVNAAFVKALKEVLTSVRDPDVSKYEAEEEAERIAQRWFVSDTAKRKVSKMLARYQLDESAIEAEAIRMSSADLELLDKMLASLEARRYKALQHVAEYRQIFATDLGESADRIIDSHADIIPRLHLSPKSSAG